MIFYNSSCFEIMQIFDILIECLNSKSDLKFLFAFSHIVIFMQCLIILTIKKYSLLVKLNQNIKQLRMDRNSKEIINSAKPIHELS